MNSDSVSENFYGFQIAIIPTQPTYTNLIDQEQIQNDIYTSTNPMNRTQLFKTNDVIS